MKKSFKFQVFSFKKTNVTDETDGTIKIMITITIMKGEAR
jgi:hypothetical protein